ncbi:MAG: lactate racemase domain-containing protein [bacterium]
MSSSEADLICRNAFRDWTVEGKRVLVVIPDHTRSCPLGMMFRHVQAAAAGARALDFIVALGTHPAMSMEQIYHRVEITEAEHKSLYPKTRFFNHDWKNPAALMEVGRFTRKEVAEMTADRFEMDVSVTVNRMINDYDMLVILGPVFPHEVVGFSGGNKYLFPGIAGQEILDFFHWLGAVITNPMIIGNKWTTVRNVVDRAAALLKVERRALCMVVRGNDLAGLYAGVPEKAWADAADLSRQIHLEFKDKPFHTVLSCAPVMYDDLWVGAKCMYKLEPVVADGGTLIIYAPHIKEVSVTHGALIEEIGYHTRDYFVKQWDRFKHYPWGVVAHSTHVRGIGTYEGGVEKPRVNVVLATGIPESVCRKINLGWMDYRTVNAADYLNREAEGILYVPKAGEILYRLKNAPVELGG